MEAKLKGELGTNTLNALSGFGSGCISSGRAYLIDSGTVFIKFNEKEHANEMFKGEMEGLLAILSTQTVTVPKPIKVIRYKKTSALAMEYFQIAKLRKYQAELGEKLARMHLQNIRMIEEEDRLGKQQIGQLKAVRNFGFHITTCCGYIPLDNRWCNDWVEFFTRQRLKYQIDLINRLYRDSELQELWSGLESKIYQFFTDIEVKPSLLHGDLWSGNAAEITDGPDPACYYGHSEFDLSITRLFGGFDGSFYASYHKLIPKQRDFDKRQELYALFHYLNHWNHFGTGYRSSSLATIKKLLRWIR